MREGDVKRVERGETDSWTESGAEQRRWVQWIPALKSLIYHFRQPNMIPPKPMVSPLSLFFFTSGVEHNDSSWVPQQLWEEYLSFHKDSAPQLLHASWEPLMLDIIQYTSEHFVKIQIPSSPWSTE